MIKIDMDLGGKGLPSGVPTFDEFCKNPDQWRTRDDAKLAEVDKGGKINRVTQKHRYEIAGFKCKTLHEVERIASNQGIPMKELDYRPVCIPQTGHKCDMLIKFMPKWEREKRDAWN